MSEKKDDVDDKLPRDFVREVLKLVSEKPAALFIIDDLSAHGGKVNQKQLSVSPKWARELENKLIKAGLITVNIEATKGVRGLRKNWELTELGWKITPRKKTK